MLFLQPVVVDDACAADRSAPAEVRIAERASYERMTWTGTTLAQNGPMDGRSPFGPNAPGANDLTPDRPLVNPARGPDGIEPDGSAGQPQQSVEHDQDTADEGSRRGTAARHDDDEPGHDHRHGGTRHGRARHRPQHARAQHGHAQHGHARHPTPGTKPSTPTPATTPSTTTPGAWRRWSLGRDALAQDEPDRAAGEPAQSRDGAGLDSAGRELGRKQHALVAAASAPKAGRTGTRRRGFRDRPAGRCARACSASCRGWSRPGSCSCCFAASRSRRSWPTRVARPAGWCRSHSCAWRPSTSPIRSRSGRRSAGF